jgi:tetratricopeptide (TPR) repeat protein
MICLAAGGCAFSMHKGQVFDDIDMADFPIDRARLLSTAHHYYRTEGPAESVARALIASENVLIREPDNELANFYGARAALWLIEFGGEEIKREDLAERAQTWAERAMGLDPSRAEYPFLAGAHLGFRIRESIRPSLIRLRNVHEYFRKAVELDPFYDQGGPLRALGTLLVQSPPWPTGVGDIDEGLELLEQAVRMFPEHPANSLYLGLAYMEDKEYESAEEALTRALGLCEKKRWGIPADFWTNQARNALKKVREKRKTD